MQKVLVWITTVGQALDKFPVGHLISDVGMITEPQPSPQPVDKETRAQRGHAVCKTEVGGRLEANRARPVSRLSPPSLHPPPTSNRQAALYLLLID